ncbi:MAG: hypothetical protein M1814_001131 [Vezdaea aestivalis]|nr:MAG: hypothetical protein M1814_001131 [Vezdaea aestivalis]
MASAWPSTPAPGLLKLVPSFEPAVLPPPNSSIPSKLYTDLLSPQWPLTIGLVYAVTVTALNRVNASRKGRPWGVNKTLAFRVAVLLHNSFLAVYSAWTFVGMVNAVRHSFPGWQGEHGLPGAVDALCQLHGPRGFGDAAVYNTSSSRWEVATPFVHLDTAGLPDRTDVGRIWNEGLAFYGWLFYVSKFYEVVDTAIILAKGKKSSLLQTYHHTGAMLCMWAGIRFMAAPIWMFVLVNSFIHTLMYTYYNLAALAVPVPKAMKQTLTTLQIIQFIVGSLYAGLHLIISYTFPAIKEIEIIPAAYSAAESITSSIIAEPSGLRSWLGAVGESLFKFGPGDQVASTATSSASPSDTTSTMPERSFETTYHAIPCVTNSGQAFAIWLNILYLAPLTWLFVSFFINSYVRRSTNKTQAIMRQKAGSPKANGAVKNGSTKTANKI